MILGGGFPVITLVPARVGVHIRILQLVIAFNAAITAEADLIIEGGGAVLLASYRLNVGLEETQVIGSGRGAIIVNPTINDVVTMGSVGIVETLQMNVVWIYVPVP